MSFAPSFRHLAQSSRASSSRYTLLHPLPPAFARSISSQPKPNVRAMYSVAQQQPADTAAFDNSPAPPYLSPVGSDSRDSRAARDKGKAKSFAEFAAAPTPAAPAKDAPKRRTVRAQKAAITMTPAAVDHLKALMSSPTEPKMLRIGVKSRGCAGMAYHLDYVPPPGGRFDEVVEQDGVKVLIDSKALFSIIGSRMDWRDNRLSAGFVFDNPNVVDTCGCGESFNIT